MKKYLIITLLSFSFLSAQADDIPEAQIQDQQEDQSLCVQQRINQCMSKLCSSDDTDCAQTCAENAKNECRQAGE